MLHDHDLVSVQEVRAKVDQAYAAWQTYRNFQQDKIDAIVEAVAAKAREHSRRLAEMAVQETGMGNVEDKHAKNMLTADLLPRAIRGMKTVGVLRELADQRITEIGVPQGVVAAICPTTNPTSTTIFKTIIALKSGNAVVLSPHPRAKQCTCTTAALLGEAAVQAGAPEGIVQCVTNSTLEGTQALMKHPRTGVILATGGSGMVRAAYSSGKPAFGVGPGNVPVFIDTSADVGAAVQRVIDGKSFDFGTVCSSEQTVVAERGLREKILAEFAARGAYLMNDQERTSMERTLFAGSTTVRAECVGQSPQKIAQLAGFSVTLKTRILASEIQGVGKEHPLSAEKLSPVLALLFVDSFEAGLQACESILRFGGLGHTAVIHAGDEARVREFGLRMPAFRVLVNTSSPQGSVGITTSVQPSMTRGCGAIARNITSDNVGPQHLINIKRVAWAVRKPEGAMQSEPPSTVDKTELLAAVERYLAGKGVTLGAQASQLVEKALEKQPASCGCGSAAPNKSGEAAAAATPKVEIVSFVSEADVRAAIARKQKIFIGPKTIVTPSAREAAGPDGILVMAE